MPKHPKEGASHASLFNRPRQAEPRIIGLEKIEGMPALQLPLFCRIITVEFHTPLTSHQGVSTLRLELAPIKAAHLRMLVWFKNIRDLAIPRMPAEGITCAYFQIEDCRSLGWEKANWKISDMHSDSISFYAEEAEIISVVFEG